MPALGLKCLKAGMYGSPGELTAMTTVRTKMVRPSPAPPPPLPAGCPWLLPSLSVLVGWCRLAGLVHTVPLSLAGYLEGYLTTELLPTAPCFGSLVDRPPPGSVRVFL